MSLLVKKSQDAKPWVAVTPASAAWTYVGFSAQGLKSGESYTYQDATRETCLVILAGSAEVEVDGKSLGVLGKRQSVFDDVSPDAVYFGRGHKLSVKAVGEGASGFCEIALSSAPATKDAPVSVIKGEDMKRSVRGSGSNTRYICDILPESDPRAESLLVVEVITPAGHSSSYPPHKHDRDASPTETLLEETYYHRLNPSQGFAFQRVYTDDRSLDESMAVEDHDVVMVPRGYHPCVAPHGYSLYYLNTMAGPKREWHFANDPAHEWMLRI